MNGTGVNGQFCGLCSKNIKSKNISETGSVSILGLPPLSRFLPLATLSTDTDSESEMFWL
jgi:hypothetical protein